MTTVLDLITSSMRLATVLASGETPTADEANDALKVLNDILENWSLERLSVWQQTETQYTLPIGAGSPSTPITIGAGGAINTTRPVRIRPTAFIRINGTDFMMSLWDIAEYDQISVKTVGGIPERFCYVNDFPLASIFLYPLTTVASTLILNSDRVLAFPATLVTVLAFPPGYEKALRYNLALNLAPEYGVTPDPAVQAIAVSSKADIKRANKRRITSAYDSALLGQPEFAYWQRGY